MRDQIIKIDYTNYKGERGWRLVQPLGLTFKSTLQHPTAQWVIIGRDVKRGVLRDFALLNIHAIVIPTADELAGETT